MVTSQSDVDVLTSCWPVLFRQGTCEWVEWQERTELGEGVLTKALCIEGTASRLNGLKNLA